MPRQLWVLDFSVQHEVGSNTLEIVIKMRANAYQFLRPFDSLQQALNRLCIKHNTEYFPEIVYLLIDIQRWTFFKVFEKSLLVNVIRQCRWCLWHIPAPFHALFCEDVLAEVLLEASVSWIAGDSSCSCIQHLMKCWSSSRSFSLFHWGQFSLVSNFV